MIRHAFATSIVVYLISAGLLLHECIFLADSWRTVVEHYGTVFLVYSAIFILNLFAAFYALIRKFALKDTGEKLAHLEKQLRGQATVSEELTERIVERK
jgi:uncharacterized membrane protein